MKRILIILLFLLVLAGVGYGAFRFLSTTGNLPGADMSPTPTQFAPPTDTPTPTVDEELSPTETEDEEESPTPTRRVTSAPTAAAGLDRSKLSITVLNGSGTPGAAGEMADTLRDLGYNVTSTGNADSFDYEDVTIEVTSANSKYLNQLKGDLEDDFTIGETSSSLSSSTFGARVIVGK